MHHTSMHDMPNRFPQTQAFKVPRVVTEMSYLDVVTDYAMRQINMPIGFCCEANSTEL